MKKEDMEKSFSEYVEKQSKQNATATDSDNGSTNKTRLSLNDVLAHFSDPACTRGDCPIHKKKTEIEDSVIEDALAAGIELGKVKL